MPDVRSIPNLGSQGGQSCSDKWNKAMDDGSLDAQIEAEIALGRKVNVDGTPTMFLNGKRVENPTAFEEIVPLIDAALAK